MASIKKFEDLICWQRARELANFIFDITDKPVFKDFDLKRQIRRAAISSMSNIAEGFDRKYITKSDLEKGLKLVDECSRLIQKKNFLIYIKGFMEKIDISKYLNIDIYKIKGL